jgi:hypothetical protein
MIRRASHQRFSQPSNSNQMPKKPSIATERQILKLERRVFKLEQQLVSMQAKYEKQIAKLKATPQPIITEEQRRRLIAARERLVAELHKK